MLRGMKRAALYARLTKRQIEAIFYDNGRNLIAGAEHDLREGLFYELTNSLLKSARRTLVRWCTAELQSLRSSDRCARKGGGIAGSVLLSPY